MVSSKNMGHEGDSGLTQTFYSAEGWFELEYPRTWECEVVENIPAFFDPFMGKGAMQAMAVKVGDKIDEAARKLAADFPFLSGKTLHDKMTLFLALQNVDITDQEITEYSHAGQDYLATEYHVDNRFYMTVMVQKNNTLVLLLYNSKDIPEGEEIGCITRLIQSVRIYD